jgi:hypothetical protein
MPENVRVQHREDLVDGREDKGGHGQFPIVPQIPIENAHCFYCRLRIVGAE